MFLKISIINVIYCFAMLNYFLILRMQDLGHKFLGESYQSGVILLALKRPSITIASYTM